MKDCSLIFRYNRFNTPKSHIQGKGRARISGSIYYFENDWEAEKKKEKLLRNIAQNDQLATNSEGIKMSLGTLFQPDLIQKLNRMLLNK